MDKTYTININFYKIFRVLFIIVFVWLACVVYGQAKTINELRESVLFQIKDSRRN